MNLKEYLNPPNNKADRRRELAEKIGVDETTAISWAKGARHPRRAIWPDIVNATNGTVGLIELASE